MDLLLNCLTYAPSGPDLSAISTAAPADWLAVVDRASSYGVAPFLYHRLKVNNLVQYLPADIFITLKRAYIIASAQSIPFYAWVADLLSLLRAAEIPFIPLKGLHLVSQYYQDPALRSMGDLDFLIPEFYIPLAYQVLLSDVYKPLWPFDISEYLESSHHTPPLKRNGFLAVELHWKLIDPPSPFHVDVEELWHHIQPGAVAGQPVYFLSPEHALLHICIHATYMARFNDGLKPFCDIAQFLSSCEAENSVVKPPSLDWDRFLSIARQWRATRSAYLALQLAHDLLGVPLPADIQLIQPADYDPLMLSSAAAKITNNLGYSYNLADFWRAHTWRARLSLFFERVFVPRSSLIRDYPHIAASRYWYFTYLRHFAVVLRRQVPAAVRLFLSPSSGVSAAEQEANISALRDWVSTG